MKEDLKLLKELKILENRYTVELKNIFSDLNKVSILIGQVQEYANDIHIVDTRFKEIEKNFKIIARVYNSKKRKLLRLQENKRIVLDKLYKKYPKTKIDTLLKEL
jgi:hypothetical protein